MDDSSLDDDIFGAVSRQYDGLLHAKAIDRFNARVGIGTTARVSNPPIPRISNESRISPDDRREKLKPPPSPTPNSRRVNDTTVSHPSRSTRITAAHQAPASLTHRPSYHRKWLVQVGHRKEQPEDIPLRKAVSPVANRNVMPPNAPDEFPLPDGEDAHQGYEAHGCAVEEGRDEDVPG